MNITKQSDCTITVKFLWRTYEDVYVMTFSISWGSYVSYLHVSSELRGMLGQNSFTFPDVSQQIFFLVLY